MQTNCFTYIFHKVCVNCLVWTVDTDICVVVSAPDHLVPRCIKHLDTVCYRFRYSHIDTRMSAVKCGGKILSELLHVYKL